MDKPPKNSAAIKTAFISAECLVAYKDTQGHGYSYAKLSGIFNFIRPHLKKHGLGVTQSVENESMITTSICMGSGDTFSTQVPFIRSPRTVKKNEPPVYDNQANGIALTYARRYGLSAHFNISSDSDPDGIYVGEPVFEYGDTDMREKLSGSLAKAGVSVKDLDSVLRSLDGKTKAEINTFITHIKPTKGDTSG